MKFAVTIILFLLAAIGLLAFALHDRTIFIVGLALMPSIMGAVPWGLAAQSEPDEEEPESDGYQRTHTGFTKEN